MKTVNSVSGGQTSAYLAANFPADIEVFSLVRIDDARCKPKDPWLIKEVSSRLDKDFIATAEDDDTLYAVLDLEQYIGREIKWVTGISFDDVVKFKGGWLPNKLHRYCTVEMKLRPIFNYLRSIGETPVEMRFGYRANEESRALRMMDRVAEDGIIYFKEVVGTWDKGPNKGKKRWEDLPYQKPSFPLIENGIFKSDIQKFWEGKPVRFAKFNNCVGCFHRNPVFLKKMFEAHLDKMAWFEKQEEGRERGMWRSDVSYKKIRESGLQLELSDLSECDSGYCGI